MHSMTATQNTRAVLGKYYYTGATRRKDDYFRQNILECQQVAIRNRKRTGGPN